MEKKVRLKLLNTFAIDVLADCVIRIHDEHTLLKVWRRFVDLSVPVLILGGGSNVLFLGDYVGTVILNRIKGIFVTEYEEIWRLHIGAGEKWHELVVYTLRKNMPGLENLAYIPGYVGSAVIQNIGAYGVEFSQFCEYVDVLELENDRKIRFTAIECDFHYRGSIFKNYLNKYAIIFVGLRLYKKWKPTLKYCELICLNNRQVTPFSIFNFIYLIRKKKLPNPIQFGNAGSFFENPILDTKIVDNLLKKYPSIPYCYHMENKIKLSAGWLIERCNLKGCIFGEAAVYYKQALILINIRQMATGTEIAALAFFIYSNVLKKFNIFLRPEVRLIGNFGEIDPNQLFVQ